MGSVYSGRVSDAVQRGQALEILWDHQVWFYDVWGVPRHGANREAAPDFVRFATATRSLASQMRYVPYGPALGAAADRAADPRHAAHRARQPAHGGGGQRRVVVPEPGPHQPPFRALDRSAGDGAEGAAALTPTRCPP